LAYWRCRFKSAGGSSVPTWQTTSVGAFNITKSLFLGIFSIFFRFFITRNIDVDREEAAIFIGINKVISRALDTNGVSVYPCKVLNRFACPYDKKMIVVDEENIAGKRITKKPDVDYLFYLSELVFAVELALAKAQEEKDSVFRIKSAEDVYQVLTNREALEKVLRQGLKEEHMQYKDNIVELFMNMKDRIKVEDLRIY
jgi:hypothetical protein